ncbi:MAG TPA: MATE family efflux transporter [Candidatus Gallacutalibacter stercoravium]|nr:MATE family efflux transporter [Candidatus Gallacutalibacter stercoravium]
MLGKKSKQGGATDMTVGSPYRLILIFSLPLLVGNIFQQLYNMVDSIVVGNLVGEKALAAVGTGFPIIFMLSSLFMGIGVGATIMISQFYGAKDMQRVKDTVGTIYTAIMIGILPLTVLGIVLADPLLRLMQVPDDGTLEMARVYMIVIFVGIIGNLGFNINAGILQGLGDSRTSLLFLMIATVINIVLDLLFTASFHMGVFGVALATIIAQIFSWIFGIVFINRHYDFIHIRPLSFHFDRQLFFQAMRLGIPSGIQQALFSIGIMVMQSLVNGYGSNFMAGFNGANKIDSFAFMPIQSFTTAITTYVGQNIGAKRMDRVKHGVKAGLVLSVGCSILIGGLLFPISAWLMRMFSQNPEVIAAGVDYLQTVLPFYSLLALQFMFSSALRGAGEMIIPLISSFLSLWIARVPIAYWIAGVWGKEYIFLSYAAGWLLGFILVFIYYKTGRWKNKSVVAAKTE